MFSAIRSVISTFWPSQPKPTPKILSLPDELLTHIAAHTREWSVPLTDNQSAADDISGSSVAAFEHEDLENSPVSLPTDLAALTATSHLFRSIATPLLMREVHITSASRLRSLALLPPHKLAHIRSLTIHLDFDFFSEFALALDSEFRTNPSPKPIDASESTVRLTFALCATLAFATSLESFSIRLEKAAARSSAWRHFAFRSRGVSFKRKFMEHMSLVLSGIHKRSVQPSELSDFPWRRLTHIHLDALQDIAPLLRMAPALNHLSLRMIEGFDSLSCTSFISDLRSVYSTPNRLPLKSLALSARNLHVIDHEDTMAPGVELLEDIGKVCPMLESLDLRVHAYRPTCLPYVPIFSRPSFSALVAAMPSLPYLRMLHLPGNLFKEDESLQFATEVNQEEGQRAGRVAALHSVGKRECDAVASMGDVAPHLTHVSFVRPTNSRGAIEERSMLYKVHRLEKPSPEAQLSSRESPEVDYVEMTSVALPPRVYEIPRNICSPLTGPSLFGYPQTLEGILAFTHDHPFRTVAITFITALGLLLLLFARLSMVVGAVTILGGVHMAYTRSLSVPMVMLLLMDMLSHKLTKKLAKEVGKRSPVVVF